MKKNDGVVLFSYTVINMWVLHVHGTVQTQRSNTSSATNDDRRIEELTQIPINAKSVTAPWIIQLTVLP
jgi:hypothetical protein